MLRRIPAVNWAFSRLRPVPHSGNLDAAPIAEASPAIAEDVASTAPAPITEISADPVHDEADLAATAAVAEDDAALSVVAEIPSDDICIGDSSSELATEIEAPAAPPATEEASAASAGAENENDVPLATAIAAVADEASSDAAEADPAPALSAPPGLRRVAKVRARPAEPADRAALIRQRWAESGIRMWNPRLHGTGEAALNIQGSVGLLPPAPGETMPRYDKLEFRMLGGQIVCEGVIVEAPVQVSHRSFTPLAEPRTIERIREPVRERQAVLA
ncbi:hypothetical protein HZZ13_07875 [Bradyrhizobium sp. CNPSo 4010]|uniref:Uncharacterized protein n=1 Tax=Bradyrhizobium agreste TaxID=2751811 RepID=A0ABS0PLD7_9BRAD|nr:hypothetical protein [Bradyrhizobium agreste]MBH5397712.1 hypothetical protein [Bradyrhizobium agreste]